MIRHLTFVNTALLNIALNISPPIAPRNIFLPPFDSPRWGNSNGSKIMHLRSLDPEIFNKMASSAVFANVKCRIVNISSYTSPSIAPRNMFLLPFDLPRWGDSNSGKIMFLRSLDPELLSYKYIWPKVQNTVSNSFGQFRPVSDSFGRFRMFRPEFWFRQGFRISASSLFNLNWPKPKFETWAETMGISATCIILTF